MIWRSIHTSTAFYTFERSNDRNGKSPAIKQTSSDRLETQRPCQIVTPPQVSGCSQTFSGGQARNGLKSRQISNLCALLRREAPNQMHIGSLIEPCSGGRHGTRHKITANGIGRDLDIETRPLAHLLELPQGDRSRLSRDQRLQIALDLAWYLLQFEATPWESQCWKSDFISIQALGRHSEKWTRAHPVLETYVSRKLGCTNKEPETSSSNEKLVKMRRIRNVKLLPLAFALTELSLGNTLEKMRIEQDEDVDDMISRLNTADRLLGRVYTESGVRFG